MSGPRSRSGPGFRRARPRSRRCRPTRRRCRRDRPAQQPPSSRHRRHRRDPRSHHRHHPCPRSRRCHRRYPRSRRRRPCRPCPRSFRRRRRGPQQRRRPRRSRRSRPARRSLSRRRLPFLFPRVRSYHRSPTSPPQPGELRRRPVETRERVSCRPAQQSPCPRGPAPARAHPPHSQTIRSLRPQHSDYLAQRDGASSRSTSRPVPCRRSGTPSACPRRRSAG